MVKIFKLFLFINLIFAIISCSQPKLTYSGKIINQKNLNNLNISNKSNLVKNFGEPSFIDPIENKYFYYSEKTKEDNFFSEKKEYSYIFVFEFDQNDDLVNKKVLNLNELQKIKINKIRTSNKIVKRGLIEKIFGGVGTQKVPNTN
jgi:outer membrane protein assembly factor BamE (lipoprotein component of BamABCDE complex)